MQALFRDLRYATRKLLKTPIFFIIAVSTLALGIGANTAIFSVMHAVLLRSLPVRDPEQLFYLEHTGGIPGTITSSGDLAAVFNQNVYERLRKDHSVFSDWIAYAPASNGKTAIRIGNAPEQANVGEVSGNFFSGLGVGMVLGQSFTTTDEDGHAPVAVLSYSYWSNRFGRSQNVLGSTINVAGIPITVVGIAAPRFYGVQSGGNTTDLWIPLQSRAELNPWSEPAHGDTTYGNPHWWNLMLMARLKPDTLPTQAIATVSPLLAHAASETAGSTSKIEPRNQLRLTLTPARGLGTSSATYKQPLQVLMGMVGMVLLIACVNIIMLLQARNASREREFSLRLALGASKAPLLRQLLAESFILVGTGAALGWLFAVQATRLLGLWSSIDVSLAPDRSVLGFTLGVSALAAVLFGLIPLRGAAATPVALVLRSSSTQTTATRSQLLRGNTMLVAQMAICIALLFGASLLLRTLRNYQNVDLGMQANSILLFDVHPVGAITETQKLNFYTQLTQKLQALPGVQAVTLGDARPGAGWSMNWQVTLDGHAYPFSMEKDMLRVDEVAPGYFHTLGVPLVAGRDVSEADTNAGLPIAVVNQTLANRYLHGNALGHVVNLGPRSLTIVGVVRDNKYESANEKSLPMAWLSYQQSNAIRDMAVMIRVSGNPTSFIPAARRIVSELDPNTPLNKPEVLQAQFAESFAMPALFAHLAVFFGALAAVLVAVGLYGTLAFRVSRRTTEIGIRMALGAQRSQILGMVLGDSLMLVGIGLLIGLPLTWFGSQLMSSMLYQLSGHDPVSFVFAATSVLIVSLLAALIPARRAASVEPVRALRSE